MMDLFNRVFLQNSTVATEKPRLVLAGGGHSHALLLRMHMMAPLDYEIVLVSDSPVSWYSGMLPGHLTGHYRKEQIQIDLVKLAAMAGVKLLIDRITGIDRINKTIHFKRR